MRSAVLILALSGALANTGRLHQSAAATEEDDELRTMQAQIEEEERLLLKQEDNIVRQEKLSAMSDHVDVDASYDQASHLMGAVSLLQKQAETAASKAKETMDQLNIKMQDPTGLMETKKDTEDAEMEEVPQSELEREEIAPGSLAQADADWHESLLERAEADRTQVLSQASSTAIEAAKATLSAKQMDAWLEFVPRVQAMLEVKKLPSDIDEVLAAPASSDKQVSQMVDMLRGVRTIVKNDMDGAELHETLEFMKQTLMLSRALKMDGEGEMKAPASLLQAIQSESQVEQDSFKTMGAQVLQQQETELLQKTWQALAGELRIARIDMDERPMPKDLEKLKAEVAAMDDIRESAGLIPAPVVTTLEDKKTTALWKSISGGSSLIQEAGHTKQKSALSQKIRKLFVGVAKAHEAVEVNLKKFMKAKDGLSKLKIDLSGVKKVSRDQETRGRDREWIQKETERLNQEGKGMESSFVQAQKQFDQAVSTKTALEGERAFTLLGAAAEDARAAVPFHDDQEAEWKFVEKYSTSLLQRAKEQGTPLASVWEAVGKGGSEAPGWKNFASDASTDIVQPIRAVLSLLEMQHFNGVANGNEVLFADQVGHELFHMMFKKQ